VDLLKRGVEAFQSQFESGGAIWCHGIDFNGHHECEVFYDGANFNIGTIHDAFAMVHSIKTSVVREHDALRDQEARKKVKYDNPLEASVVTSFETQISTILASTGKSAHSDMSTSLKTFKDFKRADRDTGVGQEINDGYKSVNERVNRLLKT
jgi:hypothetical protein